MENLLSKRGKKATTDDLMNLDGFLEIMVE